MQNISQEFLYELFKLCFRKSDVLDICKQHLKYQYLPSEPFKKVWKSVLNYYNVNNKVPTFGIISQQFTKEKEIIELISNIKDASLVDKDEALIQLEEFIKQAKFVDAYDTLAEVYNEGNKDKAYKLLKEFSEDIINFSITSNTDFYEKIYAGFDKRQRERIVSYNADDALKNKIPFGIDELDAITYGGIDATDTVLFLAQSGVGKTKLLRHLGVAASRRGYKVLHIQAEGSKIESLRGYDSTWTGVVNEIIDQGVVDEKILAGLKKIVQDVKNAGGEIFVHAYEQFTSPKISDVRNVLIDLEKNHGKIDLILLDYYELFHPSDGRKYTIDHERERRRTIGREMKNLTIEFNTRLATATQASDVPKNLLEDEEFQMSRANVSEFKNIAEPFSIFITLNQSSNEKKAGVMRLYTDKIRNYTSGQVIKICQSYKNDRFYDRKRTLEEFYFPEED